MIRFFVDDVDYKFPRGFRTAAKKWLTDVARREGKQAREINIILVSDDGLLEINRGFLEHDYYTDVITFDYGEGEDLKGEIYISVERVAENAATNGVTALAELKRIMVHGVLHLAGYKDKEPADKELMTRKEDTYLACFQ